MPKYFDQIMQEDIDIDEHTNIYLVHLGDNLYCIKAISCELNKLPSDPTTQVNDYWPISMEQFNQALKVPDNEMILEDKLTSKPFTHEQIIALFQFNPNEVAPQQFNTAIKKQLVDEWADQMMQDTFGHAMHNPHTFFFQPVMVSHHHEHPGPEPDPANNPDGEDNADEMIPAVMVFMLMQGAANNGEEVVPQAVPLMIMLMEQADDQDEDLDQDEDQDQNPDEDLDQDQEEEHEQNNYANAP